MKNLSEIIEQILDDSKVEDINKINISNKSSLADYFIIATCRSSLHAYATAYEIIRK